MGFFSALRSLRRCFGVRVFASSAAMEGEKLVLSSPLSLSRSHGSVLTQLEMVSCTFYKTGCKIKK